MQRGIGEDVEGEEGQGDKAGHQPGEAHGQVGVARGRGPPRRVQDQLVALQGDEHHGEDGHGHRHALDERGHLGDRGGEEGVSE